MAKWARERLNPIEHIKSWWPEADISHIEHDPKMKSRDRDYWIIRQSGGDGTLAFTIGMLQDALIPLVNKTTFFTRTKPDWDHVVDFRYKIGDMRHVTVFGKVALRCGGVYPGLKERVRIPVKCEYITKEQG